MGRWRWRRLVMVMMLASGGIAGCAGGYNGDICSIPFEATYTQQCNFSR